jgi:putative peptide zinc metalloprotease protein
VTPTLASRVQLHDLGYRPDHDDSWIVGRAVTGEFVALPVAAVAFMRMLDEGATIGDAKRRADLAHDDDMDALDFVGDLIGLGFVAAVDDQVIDEAAARPPSLPWLRPRHVAWVLRWPVWAAAAVIIAAGFTVAIWHHELHGYTGFFAVRDTGLNLLLGLGLSFAFVGLHEFWHLMVARAAGVDAWIGWGTRLVFLVAQTTVPGLWAADRGVRIRVYLAGMTSDLLLFSCCSFTMTALPPRGLAYRLLGQLSVLLLLAVASQFAFYMRTDVYFVIQDLLGCKRLYADAVDYLRYLAARRRHVSPLLALPARERRPVRGYAMLVLAGSGATLLIFAGYELPIMVVTLARACAELVRGVADGAPGTAADGVVVIAAALTLQGLFVRTFLRTHRSRRLG